MTFDDLLDVANQVATRQHHCLHEFVERRSAITDWSLSGHCRKCGMSLHRLEFLALVDGAGIEAEPGVWTPKNLY